ncbi:MAG: hypothetical protein WC584_04915 [Candidatus Pacearchaeota archaeon]
MGKNISSFENKYQINSLSIAVKGELKQGGYGEYYTEIEYTLPHETLIRKAKLFLNGPGKNKLEKKIINHLSPQIRK